VEPREVEKYAACSKKVTSAQITYLMLNGFQHQYPFYVLEYSRNTHQMLKDLIYHILFQEFE